MSRHIDLSTLPVPDKKRRRASFFAPVLRAWVPNPDGGIIRFLQVTRYEDEGNCRDYQLALAANDPRPLGVKLYRKADDDMRRFHVKNHRRLPVGEWVETVYEHAAVAPKPPLLLTWPEMKGAA